MKRVDFHGIECVALGNDRLSLLATASVGPRILSLTPASGENLFAELPDATLDCPGVGPFHFYGGHRLWHAPEVPSITYLPDDAAVNVTEMANGLRLTQDVEPRTSLQKQLEIRMAQHGSAVEVRHILWNRGEREHTLAPWAITQLRPGGVAILPQSTRPIDDGATLPNRSITLWPYTDINERTISWGNRTILVRAQMVEGRFKIGFPNPAGWMAYWWNGFLFVKRAGYDCGADYPDRGSSTECYCDARFLELETLGPVTRLLPGDRVEHVEEWRVEAGLPGTHDLEGILSVIASE